jgi:hypothetical protein
MSYVMMLSPFLLLMIISALFIGFEPCLYLAIGLMGLACYTMSENPLVKGFGSICLGTGMTMFLVSFIYYFATFQFLPPDPFRFRFLSLAMSKIGWGWRYLAQKLGEVLMEWMGNITLI